MTLLAAATNKLNILYQSLLQEHITSQWYGIKKLDSLKDVEDIYIYLFILNNTCSVPESTIRRMNCMIEKYKMTIENPCT